MSDDLVKLLLSAPADGLGTENVCIAAADRIEALEAAITDALRSRDEDMRDILRKGLHGSEE
jgi:hypothetical protein